MLSGDGSTKVYSSYCNSIPTKSGKATRSVGRSHSSDEIPVMGMERRASVIQSQYFRTTPPQAGDDGRQQKNSKSLNYRVVVFVVPPEAEVVEFEIAPPAVNAER